MKKIFSIFLLSFFASVSFSQTFFPSSPGVTIVHKKPFVKKQDTVLLWSTVPLTFKNYRQINDTAVSRQVGKKNIKAQAATTTGILANFQCNDTIFYYQVQNFFLLKDSWCLKNSVGDSLLLNHEQTHFNITEVYARKIRKLLSDYPNPRGSEKAIRALVNKIKQEERDENNLYDIQSVHHTDKVMQKKWDERIKKELLQTVAYTNTRGIRKIN